MSSGCRAPSHEPREHALTPQPCGGRDGNSGSPARRDCYRPVVDEHKNERPTGLTYRSEQPEDAAAIAEVVTRAFDSPVEAALVEAIRTSDGYLPDMAMVAELDGAVVGHVMISRALVDTGNDRRPIAMLSPLAVDPELQGQGIGAALVGQVTQRAERAGEPAVVLEGNPRYYGRLGFEPAARHGLVLPLPSWAPSQAAQVMPLSNYDATLRGAVIYPATFDAVATLPDSVRSDELHLRRWVEADAEVLAAAVAANLDHLRPWMPWVGLEPLLLDERRELLRAWERQWRGAGDAVFGVFNAAGAVVGGCGLHRRIDPKGLEIGYWVHVDHVRQGIATEVARLLTGLAFTVPGVGHVEIHHDQANEASAGVPKALGFHLVEERQDEPSAPAEVGIEWVWRMTADRWAQRSDLPE